MFEFRITETSYRAASLPATAVLAILSALNLLSAQQAENRQADYNIRAITIDDKPLLTRALWDSIFASPMDWASI
jgi:hypothetical protein